MLPVVARDVSSEKLPLASVFRLPTGRGSSEVASYTVTGTPARGTVLDVPPDCTVPVKELVVMARIKSCSSHLCQAPGLRGCAPARVALFVGHFAAEELHHRAVELGGLFELRHVAALVKDDQLGAGNLFLE